MACPLLKTSSCVIEQRLSGSHPQLQLYQVEAGDQLGHTVLHLEAGIHFQEVDSAIPGDQELHRSGVVVADTLPQGEGQRRQSSPRLRSELGRGRGFLDELLVAPLHRAVALEQVDQVAVIVAQQLHLDVRCVFQVALEIQAGAAESAGGDLPGPLNKREQLFPRFDDVDAHTAAALGSLDHQRVA